MLEVVRQERSSEVTLLDFGCGASHLYSYLIEKNLKGIKYFGLDLSAKFIQLSKSKFPHNSYYCVDILSDELVLPRFDYIIMNGVFTEKRDLSFEEMLTYFQALIVKVFGLADKGIAFNVMSKHVDWERDDLFHLPLDTLANILTKHLTRNYIVRNDYGLYEYTTYVYR